MTESKCAIWGTSVTNHEVITGYENLLEKYDSPRAGGKYIGPSYVLKNLKNQDDEFKAKLTTWLIEQRWAGNSCPFLTENIINAEIDSRSLLSATERLNRFFNYCIQQKSNIGDKVFTGYEKFHNFGGDFQEEDGLIMAHCEMLNKAGVNPFVRLLHSLSYLNDYELTYKAFEKIDELITGNVNSKQAFVAMWFDPNDKSVFAEGIKPAIEIDPYGKETGFKAFRVDQEHHTDFIMDFMIGNIKRSRFMVADFTSFMIRGHKVLDGKALSAESEDFQIGRGGVYYEAGFAQGLGIPVIATCRDDQKGHIHFDLKQFNTIYWKDVADLRKQLSDRIFGMFVS